MPEKQESISVQNLPYSTSISLQKFNGEITKFRTFWDRFDSSVNKNPNISPIDKFNNLQGLLEGPAARVIQGLPLTEANHISLYCIESS
jgi:hypothetical protein